tara:strand:+ start:60 stop:200 length:141 start_codon:yes stop_codon:yes gene_type:complete
MGDVAFGPLLLGVNDLASGIGSGSHVNDLFSMSDCSQFPFCRVCLS